MRFARASRAARASRSRRSARAGEGPSLSSTILELAPSAYWKLDDPGATFAQYGSGGGTLSKVNTVTNNAVAGPDGGMYPTFGVGGNGHLIAADSDAYSPTDGSFTVFACGRPTSHANYPVIASKSEVAGREFFFGNNANGGGKFSLSNGNAAAGAFRQRELNTSAPALNQWHCYLGTMDTSGVCYLYLDNSGSIGTASGPTGTRRSNSADSLRVGSWHTVTSLTWLGSLAHVALWQRQLTGDEIAALQAIAITEGWITV